MLAAGSFRIHGDNYSDVKVFQNYKVSYILKKFSVPQVVTKLMRLLAKTLWNIGVNFYSRAEVRLGEEKEIWYSLIAKRWHSLRSHILDHLAEKEKQNKKQKQQQKNRANSKQHGRANFARPFSSLSSQFFGKEIVLFDKNTRTMKQQKRMSAFTHYIRPNIIYPATTSRIYGLLV